MRPARKGPENPTMIAEAMAAVGRASMRPARKGPENRRRGPWRANRPLSLQ